MLNVFISEGLLPTQSVIAKLMPERKVHNRHLLVASVHHRLSHELLFLRKTDRRDLFLSPRRNISRRKAVIYEYMIHI